MILTAVVWAIDSVVKQSTGNNAPSLTYMKLMQWKNVKLCLRSEDAFVITCVANLMEVKVLYVQQDLPNEISSYWRFNV
jgi:hypothetical protein